MIAMNNKQTLEKLTKIYETQSHARCYRHNTTKQNTHKIKLENEANKLLCIICENEKLTHNTKQRELSIGYAIAKLLRNKTKHKSFTLTTTVTTIQ